MQPQVRLAQDVMSAVAAERVEFGNTTGMAGSVPGEMGLPTQRGGCPHDAAAKQRGKFDLQAVVGAARRGGGGAWRGGRAGFHRRRKGTVKFEVAVTGGTRTWTDEYTMLRIHRDIVTLRAPGRMMRSDALALDEATIAGIHRSTAFDSRWRYMNGGERGSEERRERGRSAPLHHHVTGKITPPTLNFRS